ncbi:MAG: ABC transporter permease [Candidatus Gastranaerophilales bacterium]|nr:ABC transporter permease [Candidatus Gastranaerophilales bacterium]
MKNMIRFELQKIWEKRLNKIAMFAGYLLIAVCVIAFLMDNSFYDVETQSYIEGLEAIRRDQERCRSMPDVLTEDYLTDLVVEMQEQVKFLDSEDEIYAKAARPLGDLFWVVCSVYRDAGVEYTQYLKIKEIPTQGGIGFYERRLEQVEEYLNLDFSYGNYSEAEKAFWMAKERQVQTPFAWESKVVMDIVWDIVKIAFFLTLVIAVCISPVFAAEYESGAVALLLTTKHGKGKLIYAKILASVLFAMGYMMAGIGLAVAVVGILFGFQGAELPVQLWRSMIPYNWTVGEACLVSLGVELLIALAITLFVACISSRFKSSMVSLALSALLLLGSVFLDMSKESRLWNRINYLMPVRVMNVSDVISTFNSYQFGNVVISYLAMTVIVYSAICVVSLLGIKGGFARHQVRN